MAVPEYASSPLLRLEVCTVSDETPCIEIFYKF